MKKTISIMSTRGFSYGFGKTSPTYEPYSGVVYDIPTVVTQRNDQGELTIDDTKRDESKEVKSVNGGSWKALCNFVLSSKEDKALHLTLKTFNKKPYVDIRKYFKHALSSKWIPTKQGVCLTHEEFKVMVQNMDAVVKTLKTVPESE